MTVGGLALLSLGACGGFDGDFRGIGNGFDTSSAAREATSARPEPDNRGVISYPNYQVAIAQRGDTIEDVAARVGLSTGSLASFNGIAPGVTLRAGETIALPSRVEEPSPLTGSPATGPIRPAGNVDVAGIAGGAIDRAGTGNQPTSVAAQTGEEPIRHRVVPGETAFTIARLYDVTPKSLGDWNGLGSSLEVREGQFLLIPTVVQAAPTPAPAPAPAETALATPAPATATSPTVAPLARPGTGSETPLPPSSAEPLPTEDATPEPAPETPASPNLAEDRTEASDARLAMPVGGSIIRPYEKGQNDGIGIAADTGTSVAAAGDGTVAAITRDTDQVPILVIRHANNLLTVYAGVDDIAVEKGQTVKRGDTIAKVRDGSPSFLHFEVREGFESVDPLPYLN
jgi:murein DD-endopeptidase MepM/ murein hydrolase activator NlpD